MPEITDPVESGRTLIYDGLAQNDLDMANHRLVNLDTSNLPPIGIPPSFVSPPSNWIREWDATAQTWTASQPQFSDIANFLTGPQMQRIDQLGRVRIGEWQASPISAQFLPTLDFIRAPVSDVNLANHKLINVADPLDPGDAVNLRFMDFMLQGLQPKEAVRCATTGSISPATLLRPVDGVELEEGDRVLVKNQANQAQNAIYIASTEAWSFATDFDSTTEMERAYCTVLEGDINTGTSWFQSNHISNINTSLKHFILFSSTPGASIIPGQGLTRTGNTVDVIGTADRIVTGPNNVDISASYVGQHSITTLGIITDGTWRGEVIDPARGGTGVNNGGKTITLVGTFSTTLGLDIPDITTGALNFNLAGNTSLNLPVSGTVATLIGTETLSNKRIVKRATSIASNPNPSINVDAVDCFQITNLSEDILSMTANLTGTATDGQELIIWIKDNGVDLGGHAITWGADWIASTDLPLPTTTTMAAWLFLSFIYRAGVLSGTGKWVLTRKLDNIP